MAQLGNHLLNKKRLGFSVFDELHVPPLETVQRGEFIVHFAVGRAHLETETGSREVH